MTDNALHWNTLTTLTLSLIAGIASAIGRHAFYSSLAGKAVPDSEYELGIANVSPQQLNVAGGTALALVCKAFLILAISTAYVELFWRAVAYRRAGTTLECLGVTHSALSDLSSFFHWRVWLRHPLLLYLAALVW